MKAHWHSPAVSLALAAFLCAGLPPSFPAEAKKERPWQRPYSGDEATGKHVLALWQFDEGAETEDSSGHGHALRLRGKARIAKDGRFGSCLESFPAGAENDKAQGAMTARRAAELSPSGAFTLELWLRPKPEMKDATTVFLLDNKYYHYPKDLPQANSGYVLTLRRRGTRWQPMAMLGFGKDSEDFAARPVALEPGTWHHLAFTYDGAGTGRLCLNGRDIGGATYSSRGAIAPAKYALAIGDRYGSIHHGCAACIDQVRISKGVNVSSLAIDVGTANGRTAFRRMERDIRVQVRLMNHTGRTLAGGTLTVNFGRKREFALPQLPPKKTHAVELPVDTTLRPGSYELKAAASAKAGDRTYDCEQTVPIVIAPRPLPHVMPVVMWGGGNFERLKDIGFTHHFVGVADYRNVWAAGKSIEPSHYGNLAQIRQSLNEHLAQGIGAVAHVSPARFLARNPKYRRIDRRGKPYPKESCGTNFPEVQAFGYNVGASIAKAVGEFPAFEAALIHTEVRGSTNVSFHEHEKQAFLKHAGFPIPREVVSKTPPRYDGIRGFPKNRVIPDNHRLLAFYRWFWKNGDGWNPLHTQIHKGLHTMGRKDFWTFHDPAVRVPSIWGSGGKVDFLSQWTYVYPDPIKIGQATDELFAMAAGTPGQQVMKMTQVIWYRRQTAPTLPKDPSKRAQWEKDIPDARFITIAPDHLREALWCKLARPIRGIMYHGWGSLVGATHGSYRFTNPKTAGVLKELIRTVVRPLGPTLLQVPDRKADVALLESFTSQMFAGRGSWGWSGSWEADMHLILQWAQIQPRIVYDETIVRDGLDGYRVLVMPHCDVLTESVHRKIAEFQRKGGIVVADEHLAPALNPDILVQSRKRTGKADADKAALQAKAAALRRELDTVYQRYGESSNPDAVVRFRRYRSTDYLFAINDKRTFGTYVGHHGRVMEKGLPTTATLVIKGKRGHVYDLVAHKRVPTLPSGAGLMFKADFGPGDGRLFMITQRPIADLRLQAPREARLGGRAPIRIAIVDDAKRPLNAVVPVQVEILDPQGRPAELSGYYGAAAGKLALTINLASNDLPGQWTIRATELASGLAREHKLAVRP